MSAQDLSREENFSMAKLAEQEERYGEMMGYLEKVAVAADVKELSVEERNFLSVAYKKVIRCRRESWKNTAKEDDKGKIESEVANICREVFRLLDSHLIPSASEAESKVFYVKMKGDYHRYLAEFNTHGADDEKSEATQSALMAYKSAQAELAPTNYMRMGLALNFAVFYDEILNSPVEARKIAQQALDEAIPELDTLDEESSNKCALAVELLRENLTVWNSAIADEGGEFVF